MGEVLTLDLRLSGCDARACYLCSGRKLSLQKAQAVTASPLIAIVPPTSMHLRFSSLMPITDFPVGGSFGDVVRPDEHSESHSLIGLILHTNPTYRRASTFQAPTLRASVDGHSLTMPTSRPPDGISFESAAVVPLGCSTAACAMFQEDFLNMQFPTEPRQKPVGKAVLIWGGSSSVGSNAIQLAVAAGYEVMTTALPRDFEYVKKLGASQVFDYNKPTIVKDLVNAFKGKRSQGQLIAFQAPLGLPVLKPGWHESPEDVQIKYVYGLSLKDNEVGKAIYEDFLPKALKSGAFVPAPEPLIAGKGLEYIQDAVYLQAKGTSAKKVVVSL
ncbi:uncharacterized protein PAC_10494 [Phialocephala subalpina]|uniref:Enoyl reductase (ER) domain-containing protein n=1 Tax=Phialocephala subalpina TaxID=576137 RepID=A0A1L7X6G4_9HELO|nr:uncharacterized protein PAC_10494 [Phialocephala subalpina]